MGGRKQHAAARWRERLGGAGTGRAFAEEERYMINGVLTGPAFVAQHHDPAWGNKLGERRTK